LTTAATNNTDLALYETKFKVHTKLQLFKEANKKRAEKMKVAKITQSYV